MQPATRVLQVVADTDESPRNAVALALHADLVERGLEVRTLALTPGRRGELAGVLPTIAPLRRSLAALTGVRAEARWADIVVFHGAAAVPPGARALRSGPPAVLLHPAGDAVPQRVGRLLGGAVAAEIHGSDPVEAADRLVRLMAQVTP